MPVWHPGFTYRYYGVIQELKRRGLDVTFGVVTDEFHGATRRGAPAVPRALLATPEFRDVDARPVRSMWTLGSLLEQHDIVLSGTGKGLDDVFALVVSAGKPFVQWNDVGDFHMFRYAADRYIVAGAWFRDMALQDRDVRPEEFVVTGDPRFDAFPPRTDAATTAGLMAKYRLAPSLPVAVFCSGAIQRQDAWTAGLYDSILTRLRNSGRFQPVIRVHPNEFAGHKANRGTATIAWKRDIPVIDRADVLAAMQLCQLIVCVETGTCIESSIYGKNCLVVGLHEWCLNDRFRTSREYFPTKRFRGTGLTRLVIDDRIRQLQQRGILQDGASVYRTQSFEVPRFSWIGGDCHVDELPDVLASPDLTRVDEAARREHVAEYWFREDRQASARIAAAVESVQTQPDLAEKLRRSRSRSRVSGWSWYGRQILGRARGVAARMTR
jgi:hypothetical protein